jgi:hypothetical protein
MDMVQLDGSRRKFSSAPCGSASNRKANGTVTQLQRAIARTDELIDLNPTVQALVPLIQVSVRQRRQSKTPYNCTHTNQRRLTSPVTPLASAGLPYLHFNWRALSFGSARHLFPAISGERPAPADNVPGRSLLLTAAKVAYQKPCPGTWPLYENRHGPARTGKLRAGCRVS